MCQHCHVVTVDVEIRDLDALAAACKRLGWSFNLGEDGFKTITTWVDDSPVPRHVFATQEEYDRIINMTREERCEAMKFLHHPAAYFHFPGRLYDCGVIRKSDGTYAVTIDWFGDSAAQEAASTDIPEQIAQAYAVELEKLKAQALGYMVEEHAEQDGTIQLTLTSYGD